MVAAALAEREQNVQEESGLGKFGRGAASVLAGTAVGTGVAAAASNKFGKEITKQLELDLNSTISEAAKDDKGFFSGIADKAKEVFAGVKDNLSGAVEKFNGADKKTKAIIAIGSTVAALATAYGVNEVLKPKIDPNEAHIASSSQAANMSKATGAAR
jgi:hypothetical protein